jgi:hypothetical protein
MSLGEGLNATEAEDIVKGFGIELDMKLEDIVKAKKFEDNSYILGHKDSFTGEPTIVSGVQMIAIYNNKIGNHDNQARWTKMPEGISIFLYFTADASRRIYNSPSLQKI